jgi:hypothetical protein
MTGGARAGAPFYARPGLLALVALVGAFAWPVHGGGWAQGAHYALTRSIADGTPTIDRYESETGDVSYRDGHYYAAKAPGVALLTVPAYLALRSVGAWPEGERGALWILSLLASALPGLALVLLVIRVADRIEPGSGLPVGLTLGVATMVLPFAGELFSHLATTALAFASFAVLLHERDGRPHLRLVAAAGVLAGLAFTFEYPSAISAVVLLVLAAARAGWLRRALAYGGGVVVGSMPALAFNVWAFGSPFVFPYGDVVSVRGASGHDVIGANSAGVFGITWPSLRALADVLLSDRGLLVLTPVAAAGICGLVLLIRSGRQSAAAWTALAVSLAYLLVNAGVTTPFGGVFGGATPGPRYLIPALPFALVALGVAYRRAPAAVIALIGVSAATMVAATATNPQIAAGEVGKWWHALRVRGVTLTLPWLLGWDNTGIPPALPFFACVIVVVVVGLLALVAVRRPALRDAAAGAAALAAWAYVAITGPALLAGPITLADALLALLTAAAAVALVIAEVARRGTTSTSRPVLESGDRPVPVDVDHGAL